MRASVVSDHPSFSSQPTRGSVVSALPALRTTAWDTGRQRQTAPRAAVLPDGRRYEDTMLKMYVGNLSPDPRDKDIQELFSQHGRVRSIRLAADVFTGQCRGFGFVEMEGHEARAAMAALNGSLFKGKPLKVNEERPRDARGGRRTRR
jgi:RNA recognition motif-containing protein